MKSIEDKIISNFENIKSNLYVKFGSVWQSEKHFIDHVERRISLNHVDNKEDYIAKTIDCLSTSQEYIFAQHEESWDNICYNNDKSWAVIFNEHGKIMTSYKVEPTKETFVIKQKRYKAKITKGRVNERFRKFFKRL